MWELNHKEGWLTKNWCFWTVVLEMTLESLGLQGDPTSQSLRKSVLNIHWKDHAEAEAPILWPPDAKNWLIRKYPDARKDRRPEETGMTEDEMVGWHHWLNGHGFEQAPGDGEGQGSLACCSPWGCKESDTERLNNNILDFSEFSTVLEGPHH